MQQSDNTPLPRRRFLQQLLVLGGVTGAGALALNSVQAGSPGQAHSQAVEPAPSSKGYRLTEHIRTYYAKAQI